MRLNRTTLIFTVEILVLLSVGFAAGFLWPHPGPAPVVSRTPKQAELNLSVTDGQVGGASPVETTLSVDGDVVPSDKEFTINGAKKLQWWTDDWAVSLVLPELTPETLAPSPDDQTSAQTTGAFVASSSGTKYHPATGCSFADRIKPENRIYFDTEDQAKAAGYEPSSCLTK